MKQDRSNGIIQLPEKPPKRFALVRRRTCWLPTWQGWLTLAVVLGVVGSILVRNIYPFLAVNQPSHSGSLVIEGWATDKTFQHAADEFRSGTYDYIYVIGGPIEKGSFLSACTNFAQLGAATLVAMGLPEAKVQAVPGPKVPQDRTYTSAVALKNYLQVQGRRTDDLHLVSEGTHARRSRVLLQWAIGKGCRVAVTAVPTDFFDPDHWWRTSAGVKAVFGETMSYLYTRLLFRPQ